MATTTVTEVNGIQIGASPIFQPASTSLQRWKMSNLFSVAVLTCVVTGGASGLGAEVCRALFQAGADVAVVDIDLQKATLLAVELAESQHIQAQQLHASEDTPKITAHKADVSSPESISAVVLDIITQHGRIDRLITCAGICENYPAVDYPRASMQRLWSINVDGTYWFAVEVAKHLIQRDAPGSIVFIGSMSGSVVNIPQRQTVYNVSKAAVRHMAASLAVEWAAANIRVNCVSPGYMQTPLTEKIIINEPSLFRSWLDATPMKRIGRPEEIVGAIIFLASDASSYMTGAELRVDGGYTLV